MAKKKKDKKSIELVLDHTKKALRKDLKGAFISINFLIKEGVLDLNNKETKKTLTKLCKGLSKKNEQKGDKELDKFSKLLASKKYYTIKRVTVDNLLDFLIAKAKREAKRKQSGKPETLLKELEKIGLLIDLYNELLKTKRKTRADTLEVEVNK